MGGTLAILGCGNFHAEFAAAIAAEGWSDVVTVPYPARCGRPPLDWDELRGLLPDRCEGLIVVGRACLGGLGEAPADFPPLRLLRQGQCFHMVAAATEVDAAIADGGYLMTPAWVADWRGKLAEMGFQPETAAEFFKDFARRLVLLDTGVDGRAEEHLAAFSATVGLPASRLPVGLDHLRLLLARAVTETRLDAERAHRQEDARGHRRELADHLAAMDMLARLAGSHDEAGAVAAIEDTFRMLFAPAQWHYLEAGERQPADPAALPAGLARAVQDLAGDWAWTPSGEGFLLRIARDQATLAIVVVEGLAFPAHRERYLNLALALSGVFALAIDNARTHKRLVEAEKMAALGTLVAGVAHEINTPLGVGLAAATVLQEKTGEIARRFAERRMTQSDLDDYLANAAAGSKLIHGNLDRIGRLVDAFRQVAVGGGKAQARRFALRSVIEETLAGLNESFRAGGHEVAIDCDPGLELDGILQDWVTIFSNLLGNSLQHGFRDRRQGRVAIRAGLADARLHVDYADDGAGMSEDARQRVFDPFFSTDLQHGMGLGMHLVYNLVVLRLRGSISCASEPGAGCRFHIEVPL